MSVMARKKQPAVPAWTPNQIVAHNIAKARLLRGWTQDQAAEACEPYLGNRLSTASWSALERSVDGTRIRQIDADELVAFARAFDLPVGFLLTPPSAWDRHVVSTPDAGPNGLDPVELFDVVIGTPDNLAHWEQYLLSWPDPGHRMRVHDDGTIEHLGRVQNDVHPRLAALTTLRARMLLREHFGDIDAAKDVLSTLRELLETLDQPVPAHDDSPGEKTTRSPRRIGKEDEG